MKALEEEKRRLREISERERDSFTLAHKTQNKKQQNKNNCFVNSRHMIEVKMLNIC